MGIVANHALVIDHGAGVDDATGSNVRQRTDMGVMGDKASVRNLCPGANRRRWRDQRGEGPGSRADGRYLGFSCPIVAGGGKGLPALRQRIVEFPAHGESPKALVRSGRFVHEDEIPDAQRQSDVGDAPRMAAKAEDDKAAGRRDHVGPDKARAGPAEIRFRMSIWSATTLSQVRSEITL